MGGWMEILNVIRVDSPSKIVENMGSTQQSIAIEIDGFLK
jgi:hypothetical protein